VSSATTARCAAFGLAWGGVAALLGARAIGPDVWGGVVASPLIGLLVGRLSLAWFQVGSGWRRALVALGGLVAGAILFGLGVGIADLVRHPGQRMIATVVESIAGTLWGVFVTGFFLALWPLAYATYWLLDWLD
jgi:hypothetical protein